jgi:deoxyhypusine synthase
MTSRRPRKPRALDLAKVRTYPLGKRRSLVDTEVLAVPPRATMKVGQLIDCLPRVLAGSDLRAAARAIAERQRAGRTIVLGMGAHPIKVGLSPLIIDWMKRGRLSCIAMNGAAIVHDFELAYIGRTSEDVAAGLGEGKFGMARETGEFLNRAITAAGAGEGVGAAVGRTMLKARLPQRRLSILATAAQLGIPVTVHVAVGTDIIHMHPSADGAAIGRASLDDFHHLTEVVARLRGGVFINLGSAVIIPEVFVKALNLARNLGHRVDRLVTIDMDFVRHYRPQVNVVGRPTEGTGKGYHFTGHHEIMLPLLFAAVEHFASQLEV